MGVLKKELTLYERNDKEELIPQEKKLSVAPKDLETNPELAGVTVKVTPLVRGELKELFGVAGDDSQKFNSGDKDGELILAHCHEPKYTQSDIKFIKPVIARSLVRTILEESGVKYDDEAGTKRLESDEFGKNSSEPSTSVKKEG